jgi:DNA repair exonuclease SbcCD ATPase subunit
MVPDVPVLERSLLRDVAEALDPLRHKQRDLQTFLASQLERLELLAGQIEQRELQLTEQADALTKERTGLDEEWAHFDQLVETARVHALEVRQERQRVDALLALQTDDGRQAELRRLHESLDQAVRERDALDHELANAKRKLGELADVAVELAEARAELARLRGKPEESKKEEPASPQLDDMLSQLEAVRRDSARHRSPRK